jgi:hypothetical protein
VSQMAPYSLYSALLLTRALVKISATQYIGIRVYGAIWDVALDSSLTDACDHEQLLLLEEVMNYIQWILHLYLTDFLLTATLKWRLNRRNVST